MKVVPATASAPSQPVPTQAPSQAAYTAPAAPVNRVEEPRVSATPSQGQPAASIAKPAAPLVSKSFSISSIIQPKVAEPARQETATAQVNEVMPTGKQPFDKEKLMVVWKKYAERHHEDSNMNLYSTLTKREPYLSSDYSIELTIDNKVQEDALNADKMNFLGYLRKELDNYDIQLKINLIIVDAPAPIAYTTSDKFKRMAEINPQLNELKDKLDLDMDY